MTRSRSPECQQPATRGDRAPGAHVSGTHAAEGQVRRLGAALALAFGASAFAYSPSAAAQDALGDEFNIQRFQPAPGPRNIITTHRARSDGEWTWSAGLMGNYAYKPFVVVSCLSATDCSENSPGRTDVPVVENLITADLLGSLTPIPPLQLGLRVPVVYATGQGITDSGAADVEGGGVDAVGVGDVELDGKYRFFGGIDDLIAAAGGAFVTLPLGTATAEGAFVGSSTVTGGIRGIVDIQAGAFFAAANLSGLLGGTGRVGNTEVGSAFRYNVGAGYRVSPLLSVLVEGFGSTRFSTERGENTLEGLLGARIFPSGGTLAFTAGAGTGLIEGVGSPNLRAFFGVLYVAEATDRDGDGLKDQADECPTDAEDLDGYQDEDGCPDKDNDLDTIADQLDKCPGEPEDADGFEDVDGCPETDNDKDGIVDTRDACPKEPETKNGYKDDDGCPDVPDTDNDGVEDTQDQCPNEAEDTDGHQDTDGCPDPDNDGDGVPDNLDECAEEKETPNGFQDEDGCPDEVEDLDEGAE